MVNIKFELFIAGRYFLSKNKERFIGIINIFAVLGIALGITVLITVMSVMNGYEEKLIEKILGIRGHIVITGEMKNWEDIIQQLYTISDIQEAIPVIERQALILSKDLGNGVIVKGLDNFEYQIIKDALISYNGNGIIIGKGLAENINIEDKVKILTPQFHSTMFGNIPRMKTYTIGGVFDLGMYEYNHNVIFMPLKDAQLLFNINDEIDKIEIRLYDINKLNKVKQSIVDKLYNNSNKLLLIDWTENNETLVNALRLEKNVMFFILFWIILIAAFNIVSSMILLVNDKMKGIAILRTIGASRGTIMRIFILYGMFIGFIGTGIGTGLGILISFNIDTIKNFLENVINIKLFDPIVYFLTTLPSHVDIYQVCSIVSMSLTISFIATIYPSYKVANIAPAKILRYE